MYICIYTCIVYIDIYRYIERERYTYIHLYVYIYIYTYMCLYTLSQTSLVRKRGTAKGECAKGTANANLLCIVPILTDDPRWESNVSVTFS